MQAVTVIQPKLTEEKSSIKRVAAYCRVSSNSTDQLHSFAAQMRHYMQKFSASPTEILDCLEYIRQLKELGVGVIFEKENINTLTMTSEFMIALYGSFAQAESESISKNVAWGKEKAYLEGKVNFQYTHLLGYKKGADGNPEIVPEETETVQLIYKLFLDGYSLKSICISHISHLCPFLDFSKSKRRILGIFSNATLPFE